MRKLIKFWNVILIAGMSIFASGCLNDPDIIMPCYGVPNVEAMSEEDQYEPGTLPKDTLSQSITTE